MSCTPSRLTQAVRLGSVTKSCLTLHNPMDGSPPGSPIAGILQARTLEWVAISFNARKLKVKVKLLSRARLLATPWTAASSIHGIFQPRILEWVAIPFSKDLPDPEIEPVGRLHCGESAFCIVGRLFTV